MSVTDKFLLSSAVSEVFQHGHMTTDRQEVSSATLGNKAALLR